MSLLDNINTAITSGTVGRDLIEKIMKEADYHGLNLYDQRNSELITRAREAIKIYIGDHIGDDLDLDGRSDAFISFLRKARDDMRANPNRWGITPATVTQSPEELPMPMRANPNRWGITPATVTQSPEELPMPTPTPPAEATQKIFPDAPQKTFLEMFLGLLGLDLNRLSAPQGPNQSGSQQQSPTRTGSADATKIKAHTDMNIALIKGDQKAYVAAFEKLNEAIGGGQHFQNKLGIAHFKNMDPRVFAQLSAQHNARLANGEDVNKSLHIAANYNNREVLLRLQMFGALGVTNNPNIIPGMERNAAAAAGIIATNFDAPNGTMPGLGLSLPVGRPITGGRGPTSVA